MPCRETRLRHVLVYDLRGTSYYTVISRSCVQVGTTNLKCKCFCGLETGVWKKNKRYREHFYHVGTRTVLVTSLRNILNKIKNVKRPDPARLKTSKNRLCRAGLWVLWHSPPAIYSDADGFNRSRPAVTSARALMSI